MSAKWNLFVSVQAAIAVAGLDQTTASAAPPPAAPPAIVQTCAACHGTKGISSIAGTPSLAAQPDIFIQYQLVFMRDGGRNPGVMQAIVKNLTDENIRDIGAYYAALPPPPVHPVSHDVDDAKVTALIQPRHCDSCHKQDFSGQGETARLAGQRPDYLAKALADFRTGARRGRGMGAMIEVSTTLHDEDMKMIAAYLATKP
jgi:cytochrome c553